MTDDHLFLANARLVLADEVIEGGWIVTANGVISEFGRGRPPARAEDMAGDLVIAGLVELHTDHIEAHYMPRPKVHWDPVSAVVAPLSRAPASAHRSACDFPG